MDKPKTQAELDEERLRELDAKIKDLLEHIAGGTNADISDMQLSTHKAALDTHKDNKAMVFHRDGNKMITMHKRSSTALTYADSLKQRIKLCEHARDLHESLFNTAEKQVEILERCLKRARRKARTRCDGRRLNHCNKYIEFLPDLTSKDVAKDRAHRGPGRVDLRVDAREEGADVGDVLANDKLTFHFLKQRV